MSERGPLQILLVEDTESDRRFVEALLAGRDTWDAPRVTNTGSLAASLAYLEHYHPDVILLDLTLPDCAGLDTLRTVREKSPDAPIVVLTGHDDEHSAISALQSGAQDYLVKGRDNPHLLHRAIRFAIERKKAERDLVTAKHQAELADRVKTETLANLTHELRTPLNTILGFAELIFREALGPLGNDRYAGYARDIHAAGEHLLDLVGDILDLAKIQASGLSLAEQDVDLARTADMCVRLISTQAEESGVALHQDIAADLDLVYADERRLRQILLNLLSNAVKFTPAGGSVRLWAKPATDGGVVFGVTDTGVGIAAADVPRAMMPFGQVGIAGTTSEKGTGLGLPLSMRLAELHGGSLSLESNPGAGTTVSVHLPAHRVAARSQCV